MQTRLPFQVILSVSMGNFLSSALKFVPALREELMLFFEKIEEDFKKTEVNPALADSERQNAPKDVRCDVTKFICHEAKCRVEDDKG